jgi:hypothetical protein
LIEEEILHHFRVHHIKTLDQSTKENVMKAIRVLFNKALKKSDPAISDSGLGLMNTETGLKQSAVC